MGALLGPAVGGLERVASPTSEPVEFEPVFSFAKALSGRVTAQRSPRPRRSWSCAEGSIKPEDAALLEGLASGRMYVQSDGYVWYSSYAVVTNVLTPDEGDVYGASWTGGAAGGAGTASDGTRYYLSRTTSPTETISITEPVAVPAQTPAAISAYISTHPSFTAQMTVEEIDPEGALVGEPHSTTVAADQHAQRASLTFTTNVRTVGLKISVTGALITANAAISLTPTVEPWASGRGCRTAVVQIAGEDPRLAFVTPTNYGRRAGRSFTITELG